MATIETITLVIAIFWALWQMLSLRDAAIPTEHAGIEQKRQGL